MKFAALLLVALSSSTAFADTIHLKNGGSLEGVVMKKDQDGVVVLLKYATVTIGSFEIEFVEPSPSPAAGILGRFADWVVCYRTLAARPWGPDLQLLPAPVIDSGAFKNVPYVLHVSDEHQFALYGDPDAPACLELGLSGTLLANESARKECLALIASFLRDPRDAATLRSLALKGERKEEDGLVFECDIEPDSRGRETWWISVSDPKALDSARVSERDLPSLTTPEAPVPPRNPTLVEKSPGKGERQEVITPLQPTPQKKSRRRSYGGGGAYWGRLLRWRGGHAVSTTPPKK